MFMHICSCPCISVHVGEGAKIGCGAVVVKPIPPFTTAAGIPAKIVGKAKPVDHTKAVDHTLVDDCSAKVRKTPEKERAERGGGGR